MVERHDHTEYDGVGSVPDVGSGVRTREYLCTTHLKMRSFRQLRNTDIRLFRKAFELFFIRAIMYRSMVYMGGKGRNNASRSNQTSHFGIMGGLAPSTNVAQGVKRFRLRRARNQQVIPLSPRPGLAFMREHGILSVNPAGSGGIGLTKVLVDRSMGPCNCIGGGGSGADGGEDNLGETGETNDLGQDNLVKDNSGAPVVDLSLYPASLPPPTYTMCDPGPDGFVYKQCPEGSTYHKGQGCFPAYKDTDGQGAGDCLPNGNCVSNDGAGMSVARGCPGYVQWIENKPWEDCYWRRHGKYSYCTPGTHSDDPSGGLNPRKMQPLPIQRPMPTRDSSLIWRDHYLNCDDQKGCGYQSADGNYVPPGTHIDGQLSAPPQALTSTPPIPPQKGLKLSSIGGHFLLHTWDLTLMPGGSGAQYGGGNPGTWAYYYSSDDIEVVVQYQPASDPFPPTSQKRVCGWNPALSCASAESKPCNKDTDCLSGQGCLKCAAPTPPAPQKWQPMAFVLAPPKSYNVIAFATKPPDVYAGGMGSTNADFTFYVSGIRGGQSGRDYWTKKLNVNLDGMEQSDVLATTQATDV